MDPLQAGSLSHQLTRFHGARLPPSQLEIRRVDTVLFLLEHGPLEQSLTNLMATAALCRGIANERGCPPRLKMMAETAFSNSVHGVCENSFATGISSSDHALLVTAASLYKRQMAQLIGAYALEGATIDGFPHLVDDETKLGAREDPHVPIRGFIEAVLKESNDPHIRELLRLAAESERPETNDPTIRACRGALSTLQTLGMPFLRRWKDERIEVMPTLNNMVREWTDGRLIPESCQALIQRHDDSVDIARSIWSGASEIAPGVFQLIEYPYEETDDVIRDQLKEIYMRDPRARYVLERGSDPASTSLSYDEALEFERRLSADDDAEQILKEVEAVMQERDDKSCVVDIAMGEIRDRDPRHTLETILERAKYIPDPGGVQYTVYKSSEDDLYGMMVRHHIPIISHNSLWLHDIKSGTARPFMVSLQGQYLNAFLSMIDS
jgi:hypothetical protein